VGCNLIRPQSREACFQGQRFFLISTIFVFGAHSTVILYSDTHPRTWPPVLTTVMQFSPGRQRSRQTSCRRECSWMQQLAWSPLQESDRGLTQLLHTELHWLDVPERAKLIWYTAVSMDVLLKKNCNALCSSCFSGLQATSAFCRSSSVGGTVLPPQYVRSSGCCCRWPDDVECSRYSSSWCHYCCFWTISEDCYEYWARIERFRGFCDEALYK